MTVRPGTQIIPRDKPPSRGAPTDTGVLFAAGVLEKGSYTQPIELQSMDDFPGSRLSTSYMYDSLEAFFREGGRKAYLGRIVGPSPVAAVGYAFDASGSTSGDRALTITAKSVGSWGNSLNFEITAGDAGGEFKIIISDDVLGVLETSPSLVDRAAAVTWSASSDYVDITLNTSAEDPRVQGPTSLASGDDDAGNATTATRLAALTVFAADLGPGQVAMPGYTTDEAHEQLLTHAEANNRRALLDLSDTATKSTLLAATAVLSDLDESDLGASFAPWVKIPGLTAGTLRTVPPSCAVAGLIARSDGKGSFRENIAAAGDNGIFQYVVDLSQVAWSDSDRTDLNEGGVNVIRAQYGQVKLFGYRTLADSVTNADRVDFANSRLLMGITAKAGVILDKYLFRQIDGRGHLQGELAGELQAMLGDYYRADSLFGATPAEAFVVDVGDQVNTDETIANGELHAVIAVRMSPTAELIVLEIVRTAITEAVA